MNLSDRIDSMGKNMVGILIRGLRSGSIVLERAQQIAAFYLDKVDQAQTEEELLQDIHQMEESMPEMKTVVDYEKAQMKELREQELKQRVEALMKEGKIEEAAALAKQI